MEMERFAVTYHKKVLNQRWESFKVRENYDIFYYKAEAEQLWILFK